MLLFDKCRLGVAQGGPQKVKDYITKTAGIHAKSFGALGAVVLP
jgi:hypothetical protein